ncbi:MAG: hypothetical protein J5I90_19705 [Caldilineales bacterium]|nr:hypothetical protein [Caldilineales bacterium]
MDTVRIGAFVEIELIDVRGQAERLAFDVVPAEAADFDRGLLGEDAPLAIAIFGQPAGRELPYRMGDVQSVRILSVRPSQLKELSDAAARRDASIKKALDAIERTNAAVFASSFSGKWGDYDPAGIEEWDDSPESGD